MTLVTKKNKRQTLQKKIAKNVFMFYMAIRNTSGISVRIIIYAPVNESQNWLTIGGDIE